MSSQLGLGQIAKQRAGRHSVDNVRKIKNQTDGKIMRELDVNGHLVRVVVSGAERHG